MTKPSKNTPQQINIALIDKPARSSRNLNIDLLEMIGTASTQPYRFQSFRIHPNYLPNNLRTQLDYPLRRVQPAEEINTTLPAHPGPPRPGTCRTQTTRQFAVRIANPDTQLLHHTTRRMTWTISPIVPALGEAPTCH